MEKFRWRDWWWVVCFCLAASLGYFHFVGQKKQAIGELAARMDELEREKTSALLERENLRLQIASQGDPSWIEMVLMRDLGVVPEGWLKVHFIRVY